MSSDNSPSKTSELLSFRLSSRLTIAVVLLGATLAAYWVSARPGRTGPEALRGALDKSDRVLSSIAESAVGLSAAIAVDGEIVWSKGYGVEDLESRAPAVPETKFRVYSLVKPMTASLGGILQEEGRLDPEAPIRAWLPDLATSPLGAITAFQLASHESGIRHYRDLEEARGDRRCETPADALAIYGDDALLFTPGAERSYSSWGFVLLSQVLASVDERPFHDAFQARILGPAGMEGTTPDDPRLEIAHRASSYFWNPATGEIEPSPPVDNTCKFGAGGYLSTTPDLVRFLSALAADELTTAATRALIFRNEDRYRATGWSEGGMGYMVVDRKTGVAVALGTNTLSEPLGKDLSRELDRIAMRVGRAVL